MGRGGGWQLLPCDPTHRHWGALRLQVRALACLLGRSGPPAVWKLIRLFSLS